jgi:molybdopterin-containing oxidoreductase family iron-sulfur binding subunit
MGDRRTHPPSLKRRRFLSALGVAGVGTIMAGPGPAKGTPIGPRPPNATPTSAEAGPQWGMVIDLRRCDGCGKCTTACQETHHLTKEQTWIQVYTRTDTDGRTYYQPILCQQCDNPPCVRVCPVGATYKNPQGVVLVDQNVCIGCRACMAACPYGARYFNWTQPPPVTNLREQPMPEYPVPQKKGTVGKCILCVHYTQVGRLPACADACPMHAIYIADLKNDVAMNNNGETVKLSQFLRDNDAVRYREELGTQPRVWYIPGHAQDLNY